MEMEVLRGQDLGDRGLTGAGYYGTMGMSGRRWEVNGGDFVIGGQRASCLVSSFTACQCFPMLFNSPLESSMWTSVYLHGEISQQLS